MYDRQLRHNVPEETKVDITETKSPLSPQMVGQNHGLLSLRNKKCPFLTKKVTSRKTELYFIVKQMIKKAINVIRIEKEIKTRKKTLRSLVE